MTKDQGAQQKSGMYRPLSESEKEAALRDGAVGAAHEMKKRKADLADMQKAAGTMFAAMLPKFSPRLEVVQAPMPSEMTAPLFEELWSVKPKVTFEK
jgi:hypothetical protein